RRWRLYAGLAAGCALYPLLLASAPEEWQASAGFGYNASAMQYALAQPRAILQYLRLAFWPAGLCQDYGWAVSEAAAGVVHVLLLGLLLAATVWAWRRKPEIGFLGAWFFLILLPTSS